MTQRYRGKYTGFRVCVAPAMHSTSASLGFLLCTRMILFLRVWCHHLRRARQTTGGCCNVWESGWFSRKAGAVLGVRRINPSLAPGRGLQHLLRGLSPNRSVSTVPPAGGTSCLETEATVPVLAGI